MAFTDQICRTFVMAQNSSFPRNQNTQQFTFVFYVAQKQACVERQRPRINTVSHTRHEFNIPIPFLELERSNSCAVARMLSNTPLPFPLENLVWSLDDEVPNSISNPCPLLRHGDVVKKISDFALRIIHESRGFDNNYQLRMTVTIEKVVVVSDSDYRPLRRRRLNSDDNLRIRSQPENIYVDWFRLLLAEAVAAGVFQTQGDLVVVMLRSIEDAGVAVFGSNPAARSAVEALEKLKYDGICSNDIGDGDQSRLICPICMEEVIIGSHVTRMPCSHMFHGDCILKWLKRGHTCPLCRFKLPIDDDGNQ